MSDELSPAKVRLTDGLGVREPSNAHDKVYSEVELADAYQKGWNDAMFRRSLGPHGIKEEK